MTEDGVTEIKPHRRWKVVIAIFPLLLFLSVAGAVWFYWSSGKQDEVDPRLAMQAGPRDGRELDEHFEKLTLYIPSRGWDSEEGRKGLRQTIAYIDGTLSPQNYGFRVERKNVLSYRGELWPVLWADLNRGEKDKWLLVEVAYDGDPADVALVLAALDRLRGSTLERGIRFVFSPRVAPMAARPLPFDVARGLVREGRVVVEDLLGENIKVLREYPGGVPGVHREGIELPLGGLAGGDAGLPKGDFSLLVTGEGQLLDERIRIERARWLAGFLRSAADRP